MKNKHIGRSYKILSVILAASLTVASTIPAVIAANGIEYPEGANCVVVSDDNISFNVENAEIDGNVFAHDNIDFYGTGSVKVDGSAYAVRGVSEGINSSDSDKTVYSVPDYSDSIGHNAGYAAEYDGDIVFASQSLDVTGGIYVGGLLDLDEVELSGQGYITAEKSIRCHLVQKDETAAGPVVIYSKDGDIIISGSELTINGIIYAPEGKVIFNVKKLTLSGGVYAEDVAFNGTQLNLNKIETYDQLVTEKLTVDAGPDREVYVGESLTLEGSANYDGVSYTWSGDKSITFDNAQSQTTEAVFSKTGSYTVKLSGKLNALSDSDTLTVKVNPDPSRTFTTDSDFNSGELDDTVAKSDSLVLGKEKPEISEIRKSYPAKGVSGIDIDSTVSKDRITSASDSFEIRYDLSGTGSANDENGIDFAFVIDNSGSMSGEYIVNAITAAKTILSFMHEGDRYAISDLGKNHIGFTDDKEVLEYEIERVKSGSGSSEPDDGIRNATELFDEQSSPDRQKYMILLADGEAYDTDYSMESMRQVSRDAAERNIRIFSLSMRNEIQNMQEAAIITGGIYKNAPDGEAIRTFMERFGEQIFNSSARNVMFKTTVEDLSIVDLENISPAPSAVTRLGDGSAELSWSMDAFEVGQTASISIPVSSGNFSDSGYKRITSGTAIYYNDKAGKGQKTYLDDITLPCDTYRDSGTWSAVYDSKRERCHWTGISWNAVYPSDSSADIYIAVSEDGINFTEDKKVVNYTVPENLNGRYIRVRADLKKGSDGSTPVIEDITVISGTMKLSEPFDNKLTAAADYNKNIYANRPTVLYASVRSNSDAVKEISWTVNGTENYELDDSEILMPTVTFGEAGTYSITLKVTDASGESAEKTFNVNVMEEENVMDIVFNDGSAPVEYTIEGEFNYFKSYSEAKTIKFITDDPSAISWACVRFVPDDKRYFNRWNESYVFHVKEDLTCDFTFYAGYGSGLMEVVAYDWNGNPYPHNFRVTYDNTAPTVTVTGPKSTYPNNRFYTEDPYTIAIEAVDENGIADISATLNDEKIELNEDNTFTFVPEEEDRYLFNVTAVDNAGNSRMVQHSVYINKDKYAPYAREFRLNRSSASIGNEIVLISKFEDSDTGLRSVVITVNDEPITLDENGEYRYIAEETGEFIFKAVAEDNRGNITEKSTKLVVTEDTQCPRVTITANRSGDILVGTQAVVTVTATDNVGVTDIVADVDGVEYPLDENGQFTFKAETTGRITICANAYDNAENVGTTRYYLNGIENDTTAPTIQYYPSAKYEYQDRNQSVSVTYRDNTQIIKKELYLDGVLLQPSENTGYAYPEYYYTHNYNFNPYNAGIGEHTFKAVCTDYSGNETVVEKTFVVPDTTPPTVSINGSTSYNTNADVELTLTITDYSAIESVSATLNGEEFSVENVPEQKLIIREAPANTYVFSVTARDSFGNERTATRTVYVRDTLKPVITLSEVAEEYIIPEVPVIRMTVTDNVGVESVSVMMNNNAVEYDGKKIVLPETLDEGTYNIRITAKDVNGNYSYETIRFTVSKPRDVTPPVIEEIQLAPQFPEVGVPIQVYVKASDDSGTVNVEVSTGNTKFTFKDGIYVYTPSKTGEIIVTIKVTDPSGNATEISATANVVSDATAPEVSAEYLSSMTVNESQTITVKAQDNKGVTSMALQMNGNNVALNSGKYEFRPSATGNYEFIASAADAAGNIGVKAFTIEVTEKLTDEDLKKYLVNENETALTKEIKDAADKLKTAAGVYDFVKNGINTQFYTGSRKGAAATFDQLGGNDVDTSSLLIAMLRYLKYPARYVSGTVQYSEAELMGLTGADNWTAAVDAINASGYDSQTYYTPSGKNLIRIAHTWVEVYAPVSECGLSGTDKTWITLDGWFKAYTWDESETENESYDAMSKLSAHVIESLSSVEDDIDVDMSDLKQDLQNNIDNNKTIKTSVRKVVVERIDKLPASAAFTIVSRSDSFADVADSDCDTVSVVMNGTTIASIKTNELRGKRMLIQYIPATDSDKALFEQNEQDWKKLNASSVSVVPAVTLDGEVIGMGDKTTLGQSQTVTLRSDCNGKVRSYQDSLVAGSMYAIVVNTYDMSPYSLTDSYNNMLNNAKDKTEHGAYSEEYLGALLDYIGKLYFAMNDAVEFSAASQFKVMQNPDTAIGIFGYEFDVTLNGWTGQVSGHLKDGLFMTDIDCLRSTPVSLCSNEDDRKEFVLTTGMMSSYYEGFVWELLTDAKGISTMSVLHQASMDNIDVFVIDSTNKNYALSKLSISDEVRQDITNYINNGYTIYIPQKSVTIGDWTGTGYMMLDMDKMSECIYRLSGMKNGGFGSKAVEMTTVKSVEEVACDPDFEAMVQQAYYVRVLMATLKMQYAALSFAATVYVTEVSTAGVVGDVIDGCVTAGQLKLACVDLANVGMAEVGMINNVNKAAKSMFEARTLLLDYYSGDDKAGIMQLAACLKEYRKFSKIWLSTIGDLSTMVGAIGTVANLDKLSATATIVGFINNIASMFEGD